MIIYKLRETYRLAVNSVVVPGFIIFVNFSDGICANDIQINAMDNTAPIRIFSFKKWSIFDEFMKSDVVWNWCLTRVLDYLKHLKSFLFFTLIGVLYNHLHLVDWCSWDDTRIGRRAIFEHEIAQILEAPALSIVENRFHIYEDLILLFMGLKFKKICKHDSLTIGLLWN